MAKTQVSALIQALTSGEMQITLLVRDDYERVRHLDKRPAGLRPSIPFARAIIAREIIQEREALGWSQSELARRAGVDRVALHRIEKAAVTPDESTIAKIDRALKRGVKKIERQTGD
jgi:DNA-binding XRE family transcriptional regulator